MPDGATIQIGVGGTPDAVLAALGDKHDLGIHSGLISDAVVDLVESGVITNARKPIDAGLTVTGAIVGTERLHRWAHRNPSLLMRPLSYTHSPQVLSAFDTFFAINAAIEVDLGGQINAETSTAPTSAPSAARAHSPVPGPPPHTAGRSSPFPRQRPTAPSPAS